jgi:hypothetical protein
MLLLIICAQGGGGGMVVGIWVFIHTSGVQGMVYSRQVRDIKSEEKV